MKTVQIPITPAMRELLDAQHGTQIAASGKPLSDAAQIMLYLIVGMEAASEYEAMAASQDGLADAAGQSYLDLTANETGTPRRH